MCTGKSYEKRENSLASLKREGGTLQGLLCSKSGGFGCNFVCTNKGYVKRKTSLASLEGEGDTFQGSLCLPLKSGGFLWHFCVHR